MAEVMSPPPIMASPSPSPNDSSESIPTISHPEPGSTLPRRVPSYAQSRMPQYSKTSQRSRPSSTVTPDYPTFQSSLPYAQVRDFAYPAFHPLHYGAQPESSGASTPTSEFQSGRRSSDPDPSSSTGGWSAGPWGGDGVMYGDTESDIAALPSTSFAGDDGAEAGDEVGPGGKNKHRKSKSYANISEFERGRRRESGGRRSREVQQQQQQHADPHMFYFHGQVNDPAGRERLRQSRGYSNTGTADGPRKDSRLSTSATLPNRSFHTAVPATAEGGGTAEDDDEQIPLDTEPHTLHHSPVRSSMGPEDEELFAGPSLALYAFEPENSNELRLVEGQEIMVSYRHGQGWLVASDPRSGEQGLVPEAYVRLIADMPNYDPVTGEWVDLDGGEEDGNGEGGEVEEEEGLRQDGENEGEAAKEADGEKESEGEEESSPEDEDETPNAMDAAVHKRLGVAGEA